jgi:hypothetical protein
MHFHNTDGDETHLHNSITTHWNANQSHNVSARARIQTIQITQLDGTSGAVGFPGAGTNTVGGGSAENIVEGCTLVRFHTNRKGAQGRGRLYLPFLPEDAVSGGKLLGSNLSAPVTGFQTFQSALKDDGYDQVVASYTHNAIYTIISTTVDPVMGVQRRRLARLRH